MKLKSTRRVVPSFSFRMNWRHWPAQVFCVFQLNWYVCVVESYDRLLLPGETATTSPVTTVLLTQPGSGAEVGEPGAKIDWPKKPCRLNLIGTVLPAWAVLNPVGDTGDWKPPKAYTTL